MRVHLRKAVDPRSTRAGRSRGGMSGNPEREGRGGGGNLAARNPKFQIPCFQVCRFSRGHSSAKSRFRVSEFPPPLRGSAEGPQNPDSMFPSVQIPGYSSANSRFRVSEFPRFKRPLCGSAEPWRDPNFQIPCFLMGRFQDTPPQIPDSKIPSVQIPGYSRANSRFRVSKFPRPTLGFRAQGSPNSSFRVSEFPRQRPPLGSGLEGHTNSEFPSFRGPLLVRAQGTPKFQIPSFRVSEAPSIRTSSARGTPIFQIPSFRGLLLQGPSQRDPQIPDSQFPSFYRVSEDPASRGPPQIPSLIPSVIPTYRVELEGLRT